MGPPLAVMFGACPVRRARFGPGAEVAIGCLQADEFGDESGEDVFQLLIVCQPIDLHCPGEVFAGELTGPRFHQAIGLPFTISEHLQNSRVGFWNEFEPVLADAGEVFADDTFEVIFGVVVAGEGWRGGGRWFGGGEDGEDDNGGEQ